MNSVLASVGRINVLVARVIVAIAIFSWPSHLPSNRALAQSATNVQSSEDKTVTTLPPVEVLDRWLAKPVLSGVEAKSMLESFLELQMKPTTLPNSLEEWLSNKELLRQQVVKTLGLDDILPATWELKLEHRGILRRDGYRIEKLTYETYPGKRIAALLYVPENISGRAPGMVSISGHTLQSKAADYVQQRNINLVKRGCVVLCYDYFGYGESKTGDHPNHPRGENGHDLRSFSFSKRNATTLEVLDAVRAIDVLSARQEVDSDRIGFTGESGGSNTTYWVSSIDPRIKLAVPVCSVTTFDYWIRTDVNWDWHQRPPGIRRYADIGTLLALHAPHPTVIISSRRGTDDQEFPLDEATKSENWARHVYRLFGANDAIKHYESVTAHGYQDDKKQELFKAVERWLQPAHPHGNTVLAAKIESLDDLRCGLPDENLTCQDVYDQWTSELPRFNKSLSADQHRHMLRECMGWPTISPNVSVMEVGHEKLDDWNVGYWKIETEPGIRLPLVHIYKKMTGDSVAILTRGTRTEVATALSSGSDVVIVSPRGTGSMAMPNNFRNWSWFVGRPIVGQHAFDLAQAARMCRQKLGAKRVHVSSRNALGFATLLAGAAEPDLIDSGEASLPMRSFRDQLMANSGTALAEVPGLFEHFDIEQLRGMWPNGKFEFP